MKACVATGEKGRMEYREVAEPRLEPGTSRGESLAVLLKPS
jgi:hypothetical protein